MEVSYSKAFLKEVEEINDKAVAVQLRKIILLCKEASSLREIQNLKKLKGHKTAYRIKMGDYRVGFYFENK